jgi:lysozyme family protein
MREGNFNFGTYLGNGQSLSRPTTIVPIGRGPFSSFEDGAVDALKQQGLLGISDWSLERIAYCLEGFNGFGYRAKGVNSPYLWAGTNRYTSGKYVRDHVFDPSMVDAQLGSMAVLWRLCALNAEVNARVNGVALKQPAPPDVEPPVPVPADPEADHRPGRRRRHHHRRGRRHRQ